MDTIFLTIDLVRWYHEQILELGGASGLRSEQLLASAVFQPQQSAFGQDAYPSIAEKAAAYGYFLVENHPFVDGNKRTAVTAMLAFLDLNEHDFHQADDEIAQMVEDLAANVIGQGEFFGWVCNHARPRQGGASVLRHPSAS